MAFYDKVTMVAPVFQGKGGRTGTYWLDVSELGATECDICMGPHMVIACPACKEYWGDTHQGDNRVDCQCGATLLISRITAAEFAKMWGA
jgi:hypothetical protein